MKKQILFFLMVSLMILLTLACAISYEGLQISDDPEPVNPISELIAQQTFEANVTGDPEQGSRAPASGEIQATEAPVVSGSSDANADLSGDNEYLVTGTDFSCICSGSGETVTPSLEINGDQLTAFGHVFDKISENTYKRSYMGYYILDDTRVDQEQHTVIIIKDNGFIAEYYHGEEGSPCCYHTYTLEN